MPTCAVSRWLCQFTSDQWVEIFSSGASIRLAGKGDFFRVQGSNGFRRYLGKDEDDQGQCECGNENSGIAPQSYGDDRGDGRGKNIDQVVADQNQADKPVGRSSNLPARVAPRCLFFCRCFNR